MEPGVLGETLFASGRNAKVIFLKTPRRDREELLCNVEKDPIAQKRELADIPPLLNQ